MKNFEKQLGKPIQPRKYWLDIDFPDGPPPEYERSGYVELRYVIIAIKLIFTRLEIADEYIALTTRPVDPLQVSRLRAALWPSAIAVSVWSSYSTLWSLQVARARQLLGIQPKDKPDSKPTGVIDLQQLASGEDTEEKPSTAKAEQESETGNISAVPNPPSPNLSSPNASKPDPKEKLQPLGLLSIFNDFRSALTSFKNSLSKTWRFPYAPPERGSVIISGLVELVGSEATCVLDVRAAFHPKENRFTTVGIGVRRLQARKQAPRGGQGGGRGQGADGG